MEGGREEGYMEGGAHEEIDMDYGGRETWRKGGTLRGRDT